MPAHDIYHDTVRHALESDGWTITHDPYKISIENSRPDYQIDWTVPNLCRWCPSFRARKGIIFSDYGSCLQRNSGIRNSKNSH